MPAPKRLTDAQLYKHAMAYSTQRTAERLGKTLAEVERDLICDELKARKKTEFEHGGLKITMTDTTTELSLERAAKILTRAVLSRVTRRKIVVALWNAEKAAGHITDTDEKHCRVDKPVVANIRVDLVGKIAA